MKLNYRDKIILAVILALAILLGSYFGLIKKKTQEIKDNQAKLETLNNEKDEIDQKINMIPSLKDKITEVYNETNELTKIFVDKEKIDGTDELDMYMRKYADENKIKILSLEVKNPEVKSFKYYYQETKDTDEKLRKAADLNGDLEANYQAQTAESSALKARTVESVLETQYGVSLEGTKEQLWNYLEAIKNVNEAINIKSVSIYDYSFGADSAEENGVDVAAKAEAIKAVTDSADEMTDEEIQAELERIEAQFAAGSDGEVTNTSKVQVVISLYSVYNMSEPDLDYIPAK